MKLLFLLIVFISCSICVATSQGDIQSETTNHPPLEVPISIQSDDDNDDGSANSKQQISLLSQKNNNFNKEEQNELQHEETNFESNNKTKQKEENDDNNNDDNNDDDNNNEMRERYSLNSLLLLIITLPTRVKVYAISILYTLLVIIIRPINDKLREQNIIIIPNTPHISSSSTALVALIHHSEIALFSFLCYFISTLHETEGGSGDHAVWWLSNTISSSSSSSSSLSIYTEMILLMNIGYYFFCIIFCVSERQTSNISSFCLLFFLSLLSFNLGIATKEMCLFIALNAGGYIYYYLIYFNAYRRQSIHSPNSKKKLYLMCCSFLFASIRICNFYSLFILLYKFIDHYSISFLFMVLLYLILECIPIVFDIIGVFAQIYYWKNQTRRADPPKRVVRKFRY